MIAVSTDDAATLRKFRESLKSKDTFVSDEKAELAKLFDVKMPVIKMAKRTTFVIGAGRKISAVIEGSDAIDPENSVKACAPAPTQSVPNHSAVDAGVSR